MTGNSADGSLSLPLANGDRLVNISMPGATLEVADGAITVSLDGAVTAGAATGGTDALSTFINVATLSVGGTLTRETGLVVTEVAGAITIEGAENRRPGELPPPGAAQQTIAFSLNENRGRSASFDATVTENGLIIRPRTDLGRQVMQSQRDIVIALAVAEVRRSLGIARDRLKTAYLDYNPVLAKGAP